MMRRMHAQRGVALVEFAILVPFLTLLLLGAIEIGRYAYFSIVVANAARAAVLYGAQNEQTALDTNGMKNAANADGVNNIVSSLTVNATNSCECWDGSTYSNNSSGTMNCSSTATCSSGQLVEFVTVTVSGTATSLFRYPFLPSSFTIAQSATQRLQQ